MHSRSKIQTRKAHFLVKIQINPKAATDVEEGDSRVLFSTLGVNGTNGMACTILWASHPTRWLLGQLELELGKGCFEVGEGWGWKQFKPQKGECTVKQASAAS